jgi:hypothetical protein
MMSGYPSFCQVLVSMQTMDPRTFGTVNLHRKIGRIVTRKPHRRQAVLRCGCCIGPHRAWAATSALLTGIGALGCMSFRQCEVFSAVDAGMHR